MVPTGDESFMIAGLDRWTVSTPNVHEPRLERLLGIHGFVLPPASGNEQRNDVPVIRFPDIHHCPACRRLEHHRAFCRATANKCNACGVTLIPSRFVVVCPKGHIDDFPYFKWVHGNSSARPYSQGHTLAIEAAGASASLSDIVVRCSCGAERSLEGAFSREALRSVSRCSGKRPWLGDDATESCDEVPRTLQRGASNNYFAIVRSSISIPPWSEGALKLINRHWSTLRHIPSSALLDTIRGMNLSKGSAYQDEDLVRAVEMRKVGEDNPITSMEDLRHQEYEALRAGKAEVGQAQDFVCDPVEGASAVVGKWFDKVMAVKRLREVRALASFTRLLPPSAADGEERNAALSVDRLNWLPAVEVQGEGVFIELNRGLLMNWERNPDVVARAEQVNRKYAQRFESQQRVPDKVVSARLLLVHTLAHALINQWSLDAGYPAAALRERLYVGLGDKAMAGFLIYTATTDSAGSLGGVIARANPDDLRSDIRQAVMRMSWCSADPLCIESDAAGADSLNLAACHSCALLPETSCEASNTLLDRGLVVGTPEHPTIGFFNDIVDVWV